MEDHLPYKRLPGWVKVMAAVLIPLAIDPFLLKRWSFPP